MVLKENTISHIRFLRPTMQHSLIPNLYQVLSSKLIQYLFVKILLFHPFLPCTEVPIKFWNVKISFSASRMVTELMWSLLTGSNQLYLTPQLSLPILRLVGILSSALRFKNQTPPPQLCLELSGKFGFKPSPQLLFPGTHTDRQETH